MRQPRRRPQGIAPEAANRAATCCCQYPLPAPGHPGRSGGPAQHFSGTLATAFAGLFGPGAVLDGAWSSGHGSLAGTWGLQVWAAVSLALLQVAGYPSLQIELAFPRVPRIRCAPGSVLGGDGEAAGLRTLAVPPTPPALAALPPPDFPEVTSTSPRQACTFADLFRTVVLYGAVALGASIPLGLSLRGVHGWWPVCCAAVAALVGWLPLWRYRDQPLPPVPPPPP